MKNIVLIRHAKSSWDHEITDILRPLSERGKIDIKKVAFHYKSLNLLPNAIYSSPARRAHDTSKLFCESAGMDNETIQIDNRLYDFEGTQVIDFIKKLDNNIKVVLIFGHNNAFTNISNIFGSKYIENVPTSGLVHLVIDINEWSNLKPGATKHAIFPKQLL